MDPVIIALVLLFLTISAARILLIRGMLKLSPQDQQKLVPVFKNFRWVNLLGMFGFAMVYLILMTYQPNYYQILAYLFLAIAIAILYQVTHQSVKKLRESGVKEDYISTFINSNLIRGAGIIICFVYLLNSI